MPASKVQQQSRVWGQFLQFRGSCNNHRPAAAGAQAVEQQGGAPSKFAGPSAHKGSSSSSSGVNKPGYLQLLTAARRAVAAAAALQLQGSSAATVPPVDPVIEHVGEPAAPAATGMQALTAGAQAASVAPATIGPASSNSRSSVADKRRQQLSQATTQRLIRRPQAVESSCSLRLWVPPAHDEVVAAAAAVLPQQPGNTAVPQAPAATPAFEVTAQQQQQQQQQLMHAVSDSQSMLLQLLQGAGMQLLQFGEPQEEDEEIAVDISAGDAAHHDAAAVAVAAVASFQAPLQAPAAAAVATGDCNQHSRAGPVCEAVEAEEVVGTSLRVLEAQALVPPAAAFPAGLTTDTTAVREALNVDAVLTTAAGATMQANWGASSSSQRHGPHTVQRLSSNGSEACSRPEADAVDAGMVQRVDGSAYAATAAVRSGLVSRTANAMQAAPLVLDVYAEPGPLTAQNSATLKKKPHPDKHQPASQQQQQRHVLQQLLTDDYLRGWEGEGSQGTQLLPTVAWFRALACLTQVGRGVLPPYQVLV
jgi:hypothetical protein